ncbi:MFS transporter [Actinoplanes sp. N902-109]|uniref:MFS transporter n=1 Tax=Actinoplanes sp. (strain N902-109) TaxID=649831 RepID=UPI00032964C4|nr:MFS transporter [Actinoplanes sp. N902-109]AGL21180.1 major facilitator superfamily protein [Actinoplanes sp. N902-109]
MGGLPATYWYLWTGLLINRVGGFAVLFLSLYLTAQRDASPALAGLIVGAYGIGGVGGTLLGGLLTDGWGRRSTLLLAHFATVVVLVLLAVTTGLAAIGALALLLGVLQAMPQSAFVAAIIDVVPAERRSRAFNLQFWAFNLGMAGASLLAGVLAEWSYVGLFLVDAASTLVTGLLIAWKVPETRDRAAPRVERGLRTPLTDRIFLVFVGLTLLQSLLYSQTNTIVPLAMSDDGLDPSDYGVLTAFSGTLIVLGQLFVPRLIDGRRKGRVLAAALAIMAAGFALLTLADGLGLYLTAAAVWTVGSMLGRRPMPRSTPSWRRSSCAGATRPCSSSRSRRRPSWRPHWVVPACSSSEARTG